MARIASAGGWSKRPWAAWPAVALCATLWTWGCSKHEPVSGFWSYAWGTPEDSVLADSAQIALRLSETGFALEREPGRLRLRHVQYGLGYADVRLDFDAQGRLWHGSVRVEADSTKADSIRTAWQERHGSESPPGRIDTDSGYTTLWSSGGTVDRDYFAPNVPASESGAIDAMDLFYGGCLAGCPLYSVRLLKDGRALFRGLRDVTPLGGFAGTWAADGFASFEALVNDPTFRTLENEYSPTPDPGTASRGLHVHFAAGETITSSSAKDSGPYVLEQVLKRLDSIASAVVWERPLVSWDTLDLQAQRWIDLDSLEALAAR
jgi:hypothetical protein